MKVYLAGKISRDDWRKSLDGVRPFSISANDVVDDVNLKNKHVHEFETYFGELPVVSRHPYIEVTGPFFLSCDHGCYHGDNSHGVGATYDKGLSIQGHFSCGCEGTTFSREEVTEICMRQIQKADLVFSYINSADCFGTLFEIGYAAGIGKPVAIMFQNEELAEAMWFLSERADVVLIVNPNDYTIRRKVYIQEITWIADCISYGLFGQAPWDLTEASKIVEESKFYADYHHLQPKERYQEYLKTNWWQRIRVERLKIDGYKCTCCGTEKNLQVHHTDYSKGWFHEDPRQDLITLCKKCHEEKVHGNK